MMENKQDTITWLHLSDLFFKDTKKSRDHKSKLLENIKNFTQENNLTPDLIFVTGDIAHNAKSEEYELSRLFFNELMLITGVDKTGIFFIPGNHDIPKESRDEKVVGTTQLSQTIGQEEISKFYRYNEFIARNFTQHQILEEKKAYYSENLEIKGHSINIWGLNTIAGVNLARKGISIPQPELYPLEENILHNSAELQIVLMHRPFDEVREYPFFKTFAPVFEKAHFFLHGHDHNQKIIKFNGIPDKQSFIINGGSSGIEDHPNVYNIVCLDFKENTGRIFFREFEPKSGTWKSDPKKYPDGKLEFEFIPAKHDEPIDPLGTNNNGAKIEEKWKQPLAQLADDTAEGKDQLDFTKDVNAFSSIIAAKSTNPPLCLGLFGDWGSGKTFFMKKLEERINALATQSQGAEKTHYHSNIVQITFNAWHYMDSNLWASMVTRIFEGLSEYLENNRLEAKKGELFKKLQTTRLMKEEAEQSQKRAQAEIAQIKKELAQVQQNKDDIEKFKKIAKEMGLSALMDASVIFLDTLDSLKQLKKCTKVFLKNFVHAPFRWRRFGFLLLLLIGILFLPKLIEKNFDFITQVTTVIISLVGTFMHGVKKAETTLKKLEPVYPKIKTIISQAGSNEGSRELLLQTELAELQEKENAFKKILAEAHEKFNKANVELAALERMEDSKPLGQFIHERAACEDYRKNLGLISLIRKDLESLSEKLKPQKKGSTSETGLPSIDRIVLYIDDLDRCPEKRVVDVLQAVHLLLFFPLFVVVVGVDSRWILRSLEKSYRPLQKLENENVEEEEAASWVWESTPQNYLEKIFQVPYHLSRMNQEGFKSFVNSILETDVFSKEPNGESNSQKLKEKAEVINTPPPPGDTEKVGDEGEKKDIIDQTPQSPEIREDEKVSTGKLQHLLLQPLRSLTKFFNSFKKKTNSTRKLDGKSGSNEPVEPPKEPPKEIVIKPVDKNKEIEQGESVDLTPQSLELRGEEKEVIGKLHNLIHTPRSLKRFINIYRIIRSRVTEKEMEEFLGNKETPGHYQIVMVLLAILTGFPHQAILVFNKIKNPSSITTWKKLIAGLELKKPKGNNKTKYGNIFDNTISQVEAEVWIYLFQALKKLDDELHLPDELESYKRWAWEVGRFSYRGGKVMEYSSLEPLAPPSSSASTSMEHVGNRSVAEQKHVDNRIGEKEWFRGNSDQN